MLMNPVLLIAADTLVAVLLAASIVSSILLSRRITRLKSNEMAMRQVIAELITATGTAERAISGLKGSVAECDVTLAERLRAAERSSADLARAIEMSEFSMSQMMRAMETLRQPVQAAQVLPVVPPPSPEQLRREKLGNTLHTAQALAERATLRLERRAA
jgi:biopolymer transport protein ExbB/TolQ